LEVLQGSSGILEKIEYIAIDAGFEKGLQQDSTAPEVFTFLYQNNFVLVDIGKNERYLFQNMKFSL
jgi:hypothetical protein